MHLPIRVRQFPAFLGNIWERQRLPKPAKPATFRLCYFVCESYFRYLYCSVDSVMRLELAHKVEFWVYCDRDQMLNERQVALLKELGADVRVIPWGKSQGWGIEQIQSIWRAYEHAAAEAEQEAIVARVDADVFFFSSWIFDAVAASPAAMVGDGHFVNFEYCQGGLYFLRASAIASILAKTPLGQFKESLGKARINVEDMAATHLARSAGLKISQLFFMMFPDEYRNAGGLTGYQRKKFACLHYSVKDKRPMLDIYRAKVLPSRDVGRFEAALQA